MEKQKVVELEKGGNRERLDIRINDIFDDPMGWLAEWIRLHKFVGKVKLYFDGQVVAEN